MSRGKPSPVARHRKAIAGALATAVGSFLACYADGELTGPEVAGVVGAILLAALGIWAAPANAPSAGHPPA